MNATIFGIFMLLNGQVLDFTGVTIRGKEACEATIWAFAKKYDLDRQGDDPRYFKCLSAEDLKKYN